jgi:hypothetical protein
MHTLYYYLRPFGCSALLASYRHGPHCLRLIDVPSFRVRSDTPELYLIEPNGEYLRYFAATCGKHAGPAKGELEKLPLKTITCRQAVSEIVPCYPLPESILCRHLWRDILLVLVLLLLLLLLLLLSNISFTQHFITCLSFKYKILII